MASRSTCELYVVALALLATMMFSGSEGSEASLLAFDELERRLLTHLEGAREAREAATLGSHPALTRLARERASELASRTELGSTAAEVTKLEQRLWRLGYTPHYWRQAIVAGHLDEATIRRTQFQPEFLRNELEHVAIACVPWTQGRKHTDEGVRANPETQTLCLVMVGERQMRYQLRVAEPLRDIETVRLAVLSEVNRIRSARGLAPLQRDSHADLAAQRHAEDMLKRGFYSHRNPDGQGPKQRSTAAGFVTRAVAENIAKVVTTPEDAVARWMASSGHRRNLLLRRARLHGLGVAVGIEDGEVVALWCQLIAD